MRYLYAILGLLAMTSNPARAQIGFAPEVGLNVSNYAIKHSGVHANSDMKLGGILGGVVDIQLTDNLYLQPSILYVTNGYKIDFDYYNNANPTHLQPGSHVFIIYNLELPVMLNYKFATPGCNRFFAGAGPYVAYSWDGAMRYKVEGANINSRADIPFGGGSNDSMTRWDVGPRINGGYQMSEGFYVRVHAQMGFFNLRPDHYPDNSKMTNYNFGVSIGYMFGGGKNHAKTAKVKVETQPGEATGQQPATGAATPQTPTAPKPNNTPQSKPQFERVDR